MNLEFVPLLRKQRDLYPIPRSMGRFRQYLREIVDWQVEDMRLPLFVMNPMGEDHVPAFLDALLVFDADAVAAQAVAEVGPQG